MDKYMKKKSGEMKPSKGVMGHEKQPMKCDAFAAQKSDLSRLKMKPMGNMGYPKQAF